MFYFIYSDEKIFRSEMKYNGCVASVVTCSVIPISQESCVLERHKCVMSSTD